MDRVERLAFNALPAALTADMWTHVYVQQANSVYAGVTHPKSTRGRGGHSSSTNTDGGVHVHVHAHDAAYASAKSCPRGACGGSSSSGSGSSSSGSGDGGGGAYNGDGPSAFEEIQDVNYFGTSHFPCCITNFPQGWPKFAQATVLWEAGSGSSGDAGATDGGAIVIASMMPLSATVVAAGNAKLEIDTKYPFGDKATVRLTPSRTTATTVKIRIPGWAVKATVNGKAAANGTLVVSEAYTAPSGAQCSV